MEHRRERITSSIGFFNFARGCGIFFVIAYHSLIHFYPLTYQERIFGNFLPNLGAGLMVMFFMISGYGFYPQKNKKCIRTQAKLLLKPYFITVCMVLLAKLGLAIVERRSFWQFGGQYIFSYLLAVNEGWEGTILGLKVDNVAMFWFFWSLFGAWIIYNCISRLKNESVKRVLVVCCVCLGWALTLVSKVWIYMIPDMLIVVGFLFIGHWMRESSWLEKTKLPAWEYFLLLFPAFITLAFGGIDMYSFTWILGPLDLLGSVCLGLLLCRFFTWFAAFEIENRATETVSYMGFHTLWILCIHAFEEKVFPWYRLEFMFSGKKYLAVMVCFVLRCLVIWIGLRLIEFTGRIMKRNRKKKKRNRPQIVIE